jgi:hypothetical protein
MVFGTVKAAVAFVVLALLTACGTAASDAVPVPTVVDLPDGTPSVALIAESGTNAALTASGTFSYLAERQMVQWVIRAQHLPPLRRYRIELAVDETARYAIASVRTDGDGRLAGSGLLTAFIDRACVGDDAAPPQALAGRHRFRVAIKDDGAPMVGLLGGASPTSTALRLPCSGNGDNQFTYRLVQQDSATMVVDQ